MGRPDADGRIRVTLCKPSGRRFFLAQWDDPITGKVCTESTKKTVERDAQRHATRLEDSLNNGTYQRARVSSWDELESRYLEEVSATKREKTRLKTKSMFNLVRQLLNPKSAQVMADPNTISKYASKLRQPREVCSRTDSAKVLRTVTLAPHTIRGHLAELRKVLRWAHDMGLIARVPKISMPELEDTMKGRPITEEEFDRISDQVDRDPKTPESAREEWKRYLRGLWLSGLRLEESMLVHWTNEKHLCPDFSGRRPMLRIQAAAEKGKKFRLLPITPDFAEFLLETPAAERKGFVFNPWTYPPGRKRILHRPTAEHAGKVITRLGAAAGVKVSEDKTASAHDFRRAFGRRWAKLVMPAVLQELMRHADIKTTMKFYVGAMAEDAADAVWEAAQRVTNTSANSQASSQPTDSKNP